MPFTGESHMYARLSDATSTGVGLNAPMRLNATRVNYHGATYALEIAGTARHNAWDPSSLRIAERINQNPNTASFQVFGFTPAFRDEVAIGAGSLSNTLFKGRVIRVAQDRFKATQGRVVWQVDCQDWTYDLSATLVTKLYTSTSASGIAADLIATYSSGFTTNIQSALPALQSFQLTMVPLGHALTRLADRVGGYWFVDYEKVIHLVTTTSGLLPDPQIIDATNRHFAQFRHGTDGEQLVNRVFVEGLGTTTALDVAVGDTTFPVLDASMFNTNGGTIKAEHSQLLTYTSRGVTGVGSTASNSLSSPGAPAVAEGGLGRIFGSYQYKVSFVSPGGETSPGVASAVVTPDERATLQGVWVETDIDIAGGDNYKAITWAPGLSLFCAVKIGVENTCATSADGIVWTNRTMATTSSWRDIAWSPDLSLFVAVGGIGGTSHINTSPDGIAWTARTSTAASSLVGVTWSSTAGLFVAVGVGATTASQVATSPDGVTWTARSSSVDKEWVSVVYGGGVFVAVAVDTGTDNAMTSPNGTAWTTRTTPANSYQKVDYAPALDQFVATRGTNQITGMESTDGGVTWNSVTIGAASDWNVIVWVSSTSQWIAAAVNGDIASSKDGITWQAQLFGTRAHQDGVYSDENRRVVLVGNDVGSAGERVELSAIPIGTAPTATRKIWRTKNGGSDFFFLDQIPDNVTTTYSDNRTDDELGSLAPTISTIEAQAGDTSLSVQLLENFLAGGGWVLVQGQYLRYTGRSGSSGQGQLTGIPASGTGAILADIPGGSSILPAGFVAGVPGSGAGSVVTALAAGDPVNLLVQRDDAASQAAYGVRELYVQDRRLGETEANNRGDATLVLQDAPRVRGALTTTDPNVRAGKNLTINLYGINETRRIQSVDITVGAKPHPLRRVTVSSRTEHDLYAELRAIREQARGQ
jgi:hypothetical protein